jgi:hypothetical protein
MSTEESGKRFTTFSDDMNLNSPPYNFPPMAFFCFVSSEPQENSSIETMEISTKK